MQKRTLFCARKCAHERIPIFNKLPPAIFGGGSSPGEFISAISAARVLFRPKLAEFGTASTGNSGLNRHAPTFRPEFQNFHRLIRRNAQWLAPGLAPPATRADAWCSASSRAPPRSRPPCPKPANAFSHRPRRPKSIRHRSVGRLEVLGNNFAGTKGNVFCEGSHATAWLPFCWCGSPSASLQSHHQR